MEYNRFKQKVDFISKIVFYEKIASLQELINFVILLFQVSHMHLSKCIMKNQFF